MAEYALELLRFRSKVAVMLQRRCSNVAEVSAEVTTDRKLVLINVKSEIDLDHLSRHRHTTTTKSSEEDLRFRHVGVAIGLRLGHEISTNTDTNGSAN